MHILTLGNNRWGYAKGMVPPTILIYVAGKHPHRGQKFWLKSHTSSIPYVYGVVNMEKILILVHRYINNHNNLGGIYKVITMRVYNILLLCKIIPPPLPNKMRITLAKITTTTTSVLCNICWGIRREMHTFWNGHTITGWYPFPAYTLILWVQSQ